ncbi:hypothetical protein HK102_010214, partial [Quaeritorhiza haematococci]
PNNLNNKHNNNFLFLHLLLKLLTTTTSFLLTTTTILLTPDIWGEKFETPHKDTYPEYFDSASSFACIYCEGCEEYVAIEESYDASWIDNRAD